MCRTFLAPPAASKVGGGRKQKLRTTKVTFRFFIGEETGLDFGGGKRCERI